MAVSDCTSIHAQAADAEAKKYEALQQAEQSAFVASVADLEQAVAAMQSYTDMSSAKAVFEEVGHLASCMVNTQTCKVQGHCGHSALSSIALLMHSIVGGALRSLFIACTCSLCSAYT